MTKKEKIIELYKAGKSPIEISKELNVYNSNVYKVLKDYKVGEELKKLKVLYK